MNALKGFSDWVGGIFKQAQTQVISSDLIDELLDKIKNISYSDKHSRGARQIPNSLAERFAMEEVISNPHGGKKLSKPILNDNTNGWTAENGWFKMAYNVEGIEIHYVYNESLNVFDDFKFK